MTSKNVLLIEHHKGVDKRVSKTKDVVAHRRTPGGRDQRVANGGCLALQSHHEKP
jgi:hypothetical protein